MRQDEYELALKLARWNWFICLIAILVGLYVSYLLLVVSQFNSEG